MPWEFVQAFSDSRRLETGEVVLFFKLVKQLQREISPMSRADGGYVTLFASNQATARHCMIPL